MRNPYLADDDALRADLLNIDDSAPPVPTQTQAFRVEPSASAPVEIPVETPNVLASGTQASSSQSSTPANLSDSVVSHPGQTQDERVSQALYAAGTATKLPDSYFTRPSDDRQKDEQRELMKQSLLAKYADKDRKAKEIEEENDVRSQATTAFKALAESTEAGAALKAKMGPAMWAAQTAASLKGLGLKTLVQSDDKAHSEIAKTNRTETQVKGKSDLAEQNFDNNTERDSTQHGYKLEENKARDDAAYARALLQSQNSREKFSDKLRREDNGEAFKAISSLPKDAFAVLQTGADIDRSINKMGGPDKIRGIGLGEGAIPNQAVSHEVDKLRRSYNSLRNIYVHDLYGGNLTEGEAKRGEAAVPGITGLRTVGEILDGLDIMRNSMSDKVTQATAGWSPEIRDTIRARLSEDHTEDPLITPQPRIDTRKGGVYAAPPSPQAAPAPDTTSLPTPKTKSPGEHPINTTTQVQEPSAPGDLTIVKIRRKGTTKVKTFTPKDAQKYINDPNYEEVK